MGYGEGMSNKLSIAAEIAAHPRALHSAEYYARRYTVSELLTLRDAFTFDDLHSRPARRLFDAARWSQRQRSKNGAQAEGVLKTPMTRAEAEEWWAAHEPVLEFETEPSPEPSPEPEPDPVKVFLVVCDTSKGLMEVELIGSSTAGAARRARWTLIQARIYGDVDQVQCISVTEAPCRYWAMCTNTAVRFVETRIPGLERVPACRRCYDKVERLSGRTFDGMPACGKDVDGQGRRCNDDPGHEGECTI